ncbi:Sexual differentiation process protein isp4 [Neonectria ditissima]|uniref:Sexual differentiation process protein isp4 n=1 Tax=Neonectria ditissima TaxID=78410 RepID=A0A0P7BSF3_9HYPO|nr:Sexual differentiation process protein isp4 [Neonectria ditissima]
MDLAPDESPLVIETKLPTENVTEKRLSETGDSVDSQADLVGALETLIQEHEHDQNFPTGTIDRAREYIENRREGHDDCELAQNIVNEFEAQKDLMINNSAYPEVRAVVNPTDDPTLPVGTFRVFVMGTIFTIGGTAIQQFFSLRMPSIMISTYVVQLLSKPMGVLMARWLPTRTFGIGAWRFTLNPGPFNQKEHILIAMMANVAFGGHSTGAYIVSTIQVLKLDRFYGETVLANSIPWQITTLLATQLIGYGCAGMARRFLVYPPSMIWQRPLANIALTKALFKDNGQDADVSANGWTISRYRFFVICFTAMFFWYFVPNFLFQGLALFNWVTWISPGSVTLALIAGSTCGLGLNPIPTLDWNIATYLGDPIITPLFTLMNFSTGMAFMGFIVAPILYFNNVWDGGYFPINSNRIYDNTGKHYDIRRILNSDFTLNETAYHEYSVPLLATTQTLNYAGFFCLYVAIPTHMFLWHRKEIMDGLRSVWSRKKRSAEFKDVHNRLMSAYPECPHWWYLVVLGVSFILACLSVTLWPTGMPIWGIVLALCFTILLQIPIGMLAAITNMEVPTSILAYVIGGYALEGRTIPNMIFKMFSFMSTSQSLNFVSDLKLAHYAKIPPRSAFKAQVYATFLAGFVALGVNHWVLRNIEDLCHGRQKDRFTCPHTHSYFVSSVMWGVVGPRRLFGLRGPYRAITYVIPLGIILPIAVYFAAKKWPRSFWRNVNIPVFMAGPLGWAPYNWSYMQGTVVLAIFFNYFIKRRYKAWWERYAYVLTSSFMAAIGISGLVMFFALQRNNVYLEWWGNRIARQGVDQGGFLDASNSTVRCSKLAIPKEGRFNIGFDWRV